MNALLLRAAVPEDAPALLEIYGPYVEKTAISFETETPSRAEFAGRIRRTLEKYPYIVAEADGRILGYAYAGAFKDRAAYSWSAETTVYVRGDARRQGVGAALYAALEALLRRQGLLNLNACIASPEIEDETLTRDSIRFHAQQGFRPVGEFHRCGRKFGRWYNMLWMEKLIGEHGDMQPALRRFSELTARERAEAGVQ